MLTIVSHDILKIANNNFLIVGEGPTNDIYGSVAESEKRFCVNFTKSKTKSCLILH